MAKPRLVGMDGLSVRNSGDPEAFHYWIEIDSEEGWFTLGSHWVLPVIGFH